MIMNNYIEDFQSLDYEDIMEMIEVLLEVADMKEWLSENIIKAKNAYDKLTVEEQKIFRKKCGLSLTPEHHEWCDCDKK